MNITIIGDGSFGTFLKQILEPHFNICDNAHSVILAVPFHAYEEVAKKNSGKHLINVCSVQEPSTDICKKFSDEVTSIHPLFGKRTPADKRNSIFTHSMLVDNDTWLSGITNNPEEMFLADFGKVTRIIRNDYNGVVFTPKRHDVLMAKTHLAAVMAAKQLKVYIDRAKDIPDEFIPNSFRLMRQFVQTLDDMPPGTIESIMANPNF